MKRYGPAILMVIGAIMMIVATTVQLTKEYGCPLPVEVETIE